MNMDIFDPTFPRPRTLDEAVMILERAIEREDDRAVLRDPAQLHFNLGMGLRNAWGLWRKDAPLVQWFKRELDIQHADDISGTILEAFAARMKNVHFDPKAHVVLYHAHWLALGLNRDGTPKEDK